MTPAQARRVTKRERFFADRSRAAGVQMNYGNFIPIHHSGRPFTTNEILEIYERCGISNAVSAMHRARERSGVPL